MDGIPYVNELVREYLLFRGHTAAYQAFCADERDDVHGRLTDPGKPFRQKPKKKIFWKRNNFF